ncbi:hypothetical protein DFH11DRAFT_1155718 [Phellopilus nigrolimitatus]|nr:hypothetical protein DFH11DRAFT_1155718 [Phellopilus nigrolimitatus]
MGACLARRVLAIAGLTFRASFATQVGALGIVSRALNAGAGLTLNVIGHQTHSRRRSGRCPTSRSRSCTVPPRVQLGTGGRFHIRADSRSKRGLRLSTNSCR